MHHHFYNGFTSMKTPYTVMPKFPTLSSFVIDGKKLLQNTPPLTSTEKGAKKILLFFTPPYSYIYMKVSHPMLFTPHLYIIHHQKSKTI